MLRRPVGFDETNVKIERTLRNRRAKVDGQRNGISGTLRVIDQRAQDRGGRGSAERADESPVIVAGPSLPNAVARGNPRSIIEKVLRPCQHQIFLVLGERTKFGAPSSWLSSAPPRWRVGRGL